jgi:hypothetical protein
MRGGSTCRPASACASDAPGAAARRGDDPGYGIVIIKGLSDLDLLTAKLDPWLHVLQALAALALLGPLVALVNAARAWGSAHRGVWRKLG